MALFHDAIIDKKRRYEKSRRINQSPWLYFLVLLQFYMLLELKIVDASSNPLFISNPIKPMKKDMLRTINFRCGSSFSEDGEVDEEEYDEEEEEEYEKEVSSDDDDEEEEEYEEISNEEKPYDALIPLPQLHQMIVTMGIMYYSRKLDFTDSKVIHWARICYLSYNILAQAFLIYVRIRARKINDLTPLTPKLNPLLSSLLPSSIPDIAKRLLSNVLTTQKTIMEYDIAQAKMSNNKLLFPLVFLFLLHFKFGQVQPLLYQAASGMLNLVYSPLWQVYILGRNLERPWKVITPFKPNDNDIGSDPQSNNPNETIPDNIIDQQTMHTDENYSKQDYDIVNEDFSDEYYHEEEE